MRCLQKHWSDEREHKFSNLLRRSPPDKSAHHQIKTSAHLHIPTSAYPHIRTSAHLHIKPCHYFITVTQSLKYFVYFSYIITAHEKLLLLLITAGYYYPRVLLAKGSLRAYR